MNWDDIPACAKALAGNWRSFDSFWWPFADYLARPQDWCIVYTHTRDSGLLELSNVEAINAILEPIFEAEADLEESEWTILRQNHDHWACGWVAGYAILVYGPDGRVTPAFEKWCEIQARLACYPVLDEEDFSSREYEATLENIEEVGGRLVHENAPEDWPSQAFSWFWDNNQSAVEPRDGGGGYPDDDEIRECLLALGFLDPDEMDEEELSEHQRKLERADAPGQTILFAEH